MRQKAVTTYGDVEVETLTFVNDIYGVGSKNMVETGEKLQHYGKEMTLNNKK